MEHEINLRIILVNPPTGVDFAVQKGRGRIYEPMQKQRSAGKDLVFVFAVNVKGDRKSAVPQFFGPVVQGPPANRFIYIDIGTLAGQDDSCWSRRMKIPLRGISWDMIDWLMSNPKSALEASVPGTGKDGSPACATVKSFDGWKLVRARKG
jgi:hypothetical protein